MIIEDLIIDDAEELKSALKLMKDTVKNTGYVSVAHYYSIMDRPELAGVKDTFYGWGNLDEVEVKSVGFRCGGYILSLPEPETISVIVARLFNKVLSNGIFGYNEVTNHTDGLEEPDMISHPPHYQSKSGLEVIDVIEAFTADLMGIEATDTGNIIKYACRWKDKNGVEDLKKAVWYANHLIEHLERKGE